MVRTGGYVKDGDEANAQFRELAAALEEAGAGWVVEEVADVASIGKRVPLRELPEAEQSRYSDRLKEEGRKGVAVGKARPRDEVGVPYEPHERLQMLVEATERVIHASTRAHLDVVEFAASHDLHFVVMEEPAGIDEARAQQRVEIALTPRPDAADRLAAFTALLRTRVID